ncbi:MAG: hypothetical protein KKE12_06110 [Proteobacteria bacterium]|nr:hypothetical protein [Pseudomonadota bacterium]
MRCIITGCNNSAEHNFSARLRRPDTSAIWAPNTEAFLCDDHAVNGMKIKVILEPTQTGNIETEISSPGGRVAKRTTLIINNP